MAGGVYLCGSCVDVEQILTCCVCGTTTCENCAGSYADLEPAPSYRLLSTQADVRTLPHLKTLAGMELEAHRLLGLNRADPAHVLAQADKLSTKASVLAESRKAMGIVEGANWRATLEQSPLATATYHPARWDPALAETARIYLPHASHSLMWCAHLQCSRGQSVGGRYQAFCAGCAKEHLSEHPEAYCVSLGACRAHTQLQRYPRTRGSNRGRVAARSAPCSLPATYSLL